MVGVVWLLWGDGSEGYLGTGIKVRGKVLWGLRSVCHLVLAWHVARPSVMHLDRRSVPSRHLNMGFCLLCLITKKQTRLEWL